MVAAMTALVCTACSGPSVDSAGQRIEFTATPLATQWDEVFEPGIPIELEAPSDGPELLAVTHLSVTSDGLLAIPNGRGHRILIYSPEGALVREVGRKGQGPGEFNVLSTIVFDDADNLLAFDADGRRLSVLTPPDYTFSHSVTIESPASRIAASQPGRVLVYTPYAEEVLFLIDLEDGHMIRSTLRPEDEELQVFLGRVHTGNAQADPFRGGFWAFYPERYAIYHYDDELSQTTRIEGGPTSSWRVSTPAFPSNLNAYDYQAAHRRWWDAQLQPIGVRILDRDLLAVTLYQSVDLRAEAYFLNLYRPDGTVVAEGLETPFAGRVIGAHAGTVYLGIDATLDESGELQPFRLLSYRIRDDFRASDS